VLKIGIWRGSRWRVECRLERRCLGGSIITRSVGGSGDNARGLHMLAEDPRPLKMFESSGYFNLGARSGKRSK
jgi:hypothetical protein